MFSKEEVVHLIMRSVLRIYTFEKCVVKGKWEIRSNWCINDMNKNPENKNWSIKKLGKNLKVYMESEEEQTLQMKAKCKCNATEWSKWHISRHLRAIQIWEQVCSTPCTLPIPSPHLKNSPDSIGSMRPVKGFNHGTSVARLLAAFSQL